MRHRALARAVLRLPLVGACRALGELPLVAEEVVEEAVAPLGGGAGPGHLQAGGDGVGALTGAVGVLPAQALLFEGGGFGVVADVVSGARAVGLSEGVAAGDEGDGLLVVHRHPAEGLTDVAGGGDRVGVAVGALGVDVDQAHLDGAEGVFQVPVAGVALVVEPGGLGTPVDVLLRLPDVLTAAGETEGLKAHRLQCDVAGEDEQVGPRQALAVLLLDRPQQAAGLVEVGVVGPAVERGEALLARSRAAAAVTDAVGARAVPGHPDDERAVVAEVGGPPVLRGRQHLGDVPFHGGKIEALERLAVVELLAQRVRHGGVLGEDLHIEPLRPPLAVSAALSRVEGAAVCDRAATRLLGLGVCDDGVVVLRHGNPSGRGGSQCWRNCGLVRQPGRSPGREPRPPRSGGGGRRAADRLLTSALWSKSATTPHDRHTRTEAVAEAPAGAGTAQAIPWRRHGNRPDAGVMDAGGTGVDEARVDGPRVGGALALERGTLLQRDLIVDLRRGAGARLFAAVVVRDQAIACGGERTRLLNRHGFSLLLSCPLAVAGSDPTMDKVQVNTSTRLVRIHFPDGSQLGWWA